MNNVNTKELGASFAFLLISGFFAYQSVTTLKIGQVTSMGPGFFPLALSILLFGIAVAMLFNAFKGTGERIGLLPWRAIAFVALAPILFGLTVGPLGFLAACVLCGLAAAMAGERKSIGTTTILILCITAFCVVVFYFGLGIQVNLFGTLF